MPLTLQHNPLTPFLPSDSCPIPLPPPPPASSPQVYGVQQMGKYKGNETLYENKALTAPKPTTAAPVGGSEFDYNATLARVFKGMEEEEQAAKKNGKKGANDTMAGALPGDIPLAGEGVGLLGGVEGYRGEGEARGTERMHRCCATYSLHHP